MSIGEAVAGPAHAHMHRHVHEKRQEPNYSALDWNAMGIDWSSAWAAGQKTSTSAPVVAATPTTTAVAEPATTTTTSPAATTTSSSVGGVFNEAVSLFEGLVGASNDLTEFGTPTTGSGSDVGSIGNICKPQGANIIKVSSTEGYDFTANFINTSGEPMTIVFWNKAYSKTGDAADAEANLGSCVAPKTPALTVALAPGGSQIVAFQDNTQAGFCQATTAIAASGAFATGWGELNMVSTGSGYDYSAIMNPNGNAYNMAISSVESSCISDMTQNFWMSPTDPVGNSDGSCFIAQSTATLTVKMGGAI